MLAAIIRKAYRKPGPRRCEGAIWKNGDPQKAAAVRKTKTKDLPSIEMERDP